MTYHSQYGQDEFIDKEVFKGKTGGFFIEMGADDGVAGSNTLFFEKERSWNGIAIEPRQAAFEKLVKNRNCICVDVCISNEKGEKEFLLIDDAGDQLSGLVENYDEKHLARIEREGIKSKTIKVECIALNDLLDKHNVSTVDYFSLDIEGGELGILQSIDFNRVKINCISVENNYEDPAIGKFLRTKGYRKLTKIKIDEVYVLRESGLDTYREPLLKRIKLLYKRFKKSIKKLIGYES